MRFTGRNRSSPTALLMDQAECPDHRPAWETQAGLFDGPRERKTYLASKRARHLTEDGGSSSFSSILSTPTGLFGFRTRTGGSGTRLTFTMRPALRDLAEVAAAEHEHAYIVIKLTELNREPGQGVRRAVLCWNTGPSRSAQYSPDKGSSSGDTVPDRHEKHRRPVDRADRHRHAARFAFVERTRRIRRVRGLFARCGRDIPAPGRARLLDELNKRLEGSDAAIGPSYL